MQAPKSTKPLWLKISMVVLVVATMVLLLGLSNMLRAEAMLGQSLNWSQQGPNQASSGELMFRSERGYARALHLDTDVKVQINGLVAEVVMTQSFKNQSAKFLEGVYVFPLQEKTAVSGMTMIIGERKIVGKIREKQQAKKIYQTAKKAGKRAALTEQQRPNLFKQQLANIGPGEKITVELRYVQGVEIATVDHSLQFSLRLPTTLTPRYNPSAASINNNAKIKLGVDGWQAFTETETEKKAVVSEVEANMTAAAPKLLMNLAVELRAGLPLADISTPYHNMVISKQSDFHRLHFAEGAEVMDRDVVINWRPVATATPEAAVFLQSKEQQDFALLMVQPPKIKPDESQARLAREITFVIDTSGSMGGESIRQAKAGLLKALESLKAEDKFNIIEFNSSFSSWSTKPQAADSAALNNARGFVRQLEAGGGTVMAAPLLSALQQASDKRYVKQLVFITDGAISNESELFEIIHKNLGRSRLFTVGIGSAPNSFFMRKAAQFGRGQFIYIGDVNEVETKISALFKTLSGTVLSNIEIRWPKHLDVEQWPKRVPDLYAGEPLLVLAKLSDKNETEAAIGKVEVTGQVAGNSEANSPSRTWTSELNLPANIVSDNKGIASLWGRKKIADLLDQKHRGAKAELIAQQVLKVALKQQLLSPYTSFIAVEETQTRPKDTPVQQQRLSNTPPKGQQLAYPKTATSAQYNLILGVALLLAYLLFGRVWFNLASFNRGEAHRGD